jgi:CheY-like chemotaxis protein
VGGKVIVVAEDDFVLASVLQATLEAVGHQVVAVAPTGEEALAIAFRRKPDVVILDVNLAGEMNGIETAERLRRRLDCPVIFHTAHDDREHRERMLAIPDAAVVPKPGPIVRIVEAVAAAGDAPQ